MKFILRKTIPLNRFLKLITGLVLGKNKTEINFYQSAKKESAAHLSQTIFLYS